MSQAAAGGPRASTGLHCHGRPLRLPMGHGARSTGSKGRPLPGPPLSNSPGGLPPPSLVGAWPAGSRFRQTRKPEVEIPSPPQPDSESDSGSEGRLRPGLGPAPKLQVTSLIGHCHLEPDSCTLMAQKESVCPKKSSCTRVLCWRRHRDSKSCLNGYKSPKCAALCWDAHVARRVRKHVGLLPALCTRAGPTSDGAESGQPDRWLTSDGGSFASRAGWTKQGAAVGRQPLLALERTAHAEPRHVDPHARRQSRTRCSLARTLDPRMRDAERAPEMRSSVDGRAAGSCGRCRAASRGRPRLGVRALLVRGRGGRAQKVGPTGEDVLETVVCSIAATAPRALTGLQRSARRGHCAPYESSTAALCSRR